MTRIASQRVFVLLRSTQHPHRTQQDLWRCIDTIECLVQMIEQLLTSVQQHMLTFEDLRSNQLAEHVLTEECSATELVRLLELDACVILGQGRHKFLQQSQLRDAVAMFSSWTPPT
jgi:hypothetical protein